MRARARWKRKSGAPLQKNTRKKRTEWCRCSAAARRRWRRVIIAQRDFLSAAARLALQSVFHEGILFPIRDAYPDACRFVLAEGESPLVVERSSSLLLGPAASAVTVAVQRWIWESVGDP